MRRVILAFALLLSPAFATDRPERAFQECPDCPEMVGIPAGSFLMGSPAHEPGRFDSEGPQHRVTVKAFALAKYDVTSAEFLKFLSATGYQPKPCNPIQSIGWRSPGDGKAYAPSPSSFEPPRWPAVCLDWNDANAYIAWLNKRAHEERPALGGRSGPYRLPSEAEWEYAARGGTTTARWWGDALGKGHANCNGCGSEWDYNTLADVDAFASNPFGLFGMLGNAWEWTQDCWHPSYAGAPSDGRAWVGGACDKRVIRGGAWNNLPVFVRSAARSGAGPNGGEFDYSSLAGFRVARDLP
ncbi:MAG TPA: formylglycine-generating enzyme family protein [Rhizomicrobium sp.]|nr:formylglycine-generating enzyme family protein [Rhizomicrobium sp.]